MPDALEITSFQTSLAYQLQERLELFSDSICDSNEWSRRISLGGSHENSVHVSSFNGFYMYMNKLTL